jgi:hypothetical protein
MKITVNNTLLELHTGARVRDAVLKFIIHLGKKKPGGCLRLKTDSGIKLPATGNLQMATPFLSE